MECRQAAGNSLFNQTLKMQQGFSSTFGQFLQHFVGDSVASGRFLLFFCFAFGASELRQRQRFIQRCMFIECFIVFEVVSMIGFYIDLVRFEASTIVIITRFLEKLCAKSSAFSLSLSSNIPLSFSVIFLQRVE